jgi:AcrR family transcriptional regulator
MYHALIVDSAERVFAEQGFESGTMQDIANEAGVSLKTVYANFEGKDDLFRAIHRDRVTALTEELAHVYVSDREPAEMLREAVRSHVSFLVERPAYMRLQLRSLRSWGMDADSEEAFDHGGRDSLIALLERGIAAGVFYPGEPVRIAPMVLAVMQVQLADQLRHPDEVDADEVADQIMRHLGRLLCVPENERRVRRIA